jgi:hypothetical protein
MRFVFWTCAEGLYSLCHPVLKEFIGKFFLVTPHVQRPRFSQQVQAFCLNCILMFYAKSGAASGIHTYIYIGHFITAVLLSIFHTLPN